jgi:hypothetical protein
LSISTTEFGESYEGQQTNKIRNEKVSHVHTIDQKQADAQKEPR